MPKAEGGIMLTDAKRQGQRTINKPKRPRPKGQQCTSTPMVATEYKLETDHTFCSPSLNTVVQSMSKRWYKDGSVKFNRCKETDTTNWKLLVWKFGETLVEMDGKESTLEKMIETLKHSESGSFRVVQWKLESRAESTDKMLAFLAKKKCDLRKFHGMAAKQHVQLWEQMRLMEKPNQKQLARVRLRVIMQKSYGFNPFRKLKITVPYANII